MSEKQSHSQKTLELLTDVRKSFEPLETPREVTTNRAIAIELAKKKPEAKKAKSLSAINNARK
jgi:hypothetical protein